MGLEGEIGRVVFPSHIKDTETTIKIYIKPTL